MPRQAFYTWVADASGRLQRALFARYNRRALMDSLASTTTILVLMAPSAGAEPVQGWSVEVRTGGMHS